MAKNALQAQLLKAGLVDSKKAKKLTKQAQHAKRTGDAENIEAKKEYQDMKKFFNVSPTMENYVY